MFDKKRWNEENKEKIKEQKAEYYKQNKERMKQQQAELKRKNRLLLIEMLGGKCVDCGTTERLEFDHINPGDKTSNIGHNLSSINRAKDEASKCELRCHCCHKERTRQQKELAWHLLSIIPEHQRRMLYSQHPQNLEQLFHLLKLS